MYHMSKSSLHLPKVKSMSQKTRLTLIPITETLVQFGYSLVWDRNLFLFLLFMFRVFHRRDFTYPESRTGRKRKFEITFCWKWSFSNTYRFCYAYCLYSCNVHCIQMYTRHLQLTRLFWKPFPDLTPKMQRSPRYISLGSIPQLFCQSFTISLNENKTQQNPVFFFHVI